MRAELEIIIVLLELDHFAVARVKGAVGQTILVREKRFFLGGIKTGVSGLVEMAGGVELCERGLYVFLVARLRGAHEIVIRQFQLLDERLPVGGEGVAIFLRIFFLRQGGLLDLLAVLVKAGEKKHFLAQAAACAGDDIGNDFLVGMAEVRLPIDVIDRRRDVKPFIHYDKIERIVWRRNGGMAMLGRLNRERACTVVRLRLSFSQIYSLRVHQAVEQLSVAGETQAGSGDAGGSA